MRICKQCNIEKPLELLVKDRHSKDGRKNLCKLCANKRVREKYKPKFLEKHPGYEKLRWLRIKETGLKSAYTLAKTPIDPYTYSELFEQQNGACKICKNPPGKKRLSVDHNHLTGKVRGLLCLTCNSMLGMAKDSVDILQAGIAYLQENQN